MVAEPAVFGAICLPGHDHYVATLVQAGYIAVHTSPANLVVSLSEIGDRDSPRPPAMSQPLGLQSLLSGEPNQSRAAPVRAPASLSQFATPRPELNAVTRCYVDWSRVSL